MYIYIYIYMRTHNDDNRNNHNDSMHLYKDMIKYECIKSGCKMMSTDGGFKRVGVVGLGLMGHGIAQIAAQAGYQVLAIEAQDAALSTGMKRIETSLDKTLMRDMKKGLLTEQEVKDKYGDIMSRISTTTKLEDAHDCDLMIEVIVENMEIKIDFFKNLGKIIRPEAVFASNTSSLPITAMALASGLLE
jgi:3-hydroxyacyl-CoA dehydrogenase